MEAASSGSLPSVWPSQMMSKAPSVFPFFSTYSYLPNSLWCCATRFVTPADRSHQHHSSRGATARALSHHHPRLGSRRPARRAYTEGDVNGRDPR